MTYHYDPSADVLIVELAPGEQWSIPSIRVADSNAVLRLAGARITAVEILHASRTYPIDWLKKSAPAVPARTEETAVRVNATS